MSIIGCFAVSLMFSVIWTCCLPIFASFSIYILLIFSFHGEYIQYDIISKSCFVLTESYRQLLLLLILIYYYYYCYDNTIFTVMLVQYHAFYFRQCCNKYFLKVCKY